MRMHNDRGDASVLQEVPAQNNRRASFARLIFSHWTAPSDRLSWLESRGFHTLRGGINPGDFRFRSLVAGVVDKWKYSRTDDGALSSPGGA